MLCHTIAHALLQLLQALWERAVQAFDIIGLVDISCCVSKCSLQLLLHIIKAARLKRMLLQVIATTGHCKCKANLESSERSYRHLPKHSMGSPRPPESGFGAAAPHYSAFLRDPHKLLACAMKTAE